MTTPTNRSEIIEAIRDVVTEILADRGVAVTRSEIEPDTPLFDFDDSGASSLDLDSMDALDLISVLEERFAVSLPDDVDFDSVRVVSDVVGIIEACMPESGN